MAHFQKIYQFFTFCIFSNLRTSLSIQSCLSLFCTSASLRESHLDIIERDSSSNKAHIRAYIYIYIHSVFNFRAKATRRYIYARVYLCIWRIRNKKEKSYHPVVSRVSYSRGSERISLKGKRIYDVYAKEENLDTHFRFFL